MFKYIKRGEKVRHVITGQYFIFIGYTSDRKEVKIKEAYYDNQRGCNIYSSLTLSKYEIEKVQ